MIWILGVVLCVPLIVFGGLLVLGVTLLGGSSRALTRLAGARSVTAAPARPAERPVVLALASAGVDHLETPALLGRVG